MCSSCVSDEVGCRVIRTPPLTGTYDETAHRLLPHHPLFYRLQAVWHLCRDHHRHRCRVGAGRLAALAAWSLRDDALDHAGLDRRLRRADPAPARSDLRDVEADPRQLALRRCLYCRQPDRQTALGRAHDGSRHQRAGTDLAAAERGLGAVLRRLGTHQPVRRLHRQRLSCRPAGADRSHRHQRDRSRHLRRTVRWSPARALRNRTCERSGLGQLQAVRYDGADDPVRDRAGVLSRAPCAGVRSRAGARPKRSPAPRRPPSPATTGDTR